LLDPVKSGQIASDLIESGGDTLLGTILAAIELLLDGMSDQCGRRGKAFLLYCLLNLSMSFIRKADGGLRHNAPSLSKAWRGAFSDMLDKKIWVTPKRKSRQRKRLPW
jgi:hypothetical protein